MPKRLLAAVCRECHSERLFCWLPQVLQAGDEVLLLAVIPAASQLRRQEDFFASAYAACCTPAVYTEAAAESVCEHIASTATTFLTAQAAAIEAAAGIKPAILVCQAEQSSTAKEIVAACARLSADLLVVGCKQQDCSLAEYCCKQASCPVLVTKE